VIDPLKHLPPSADRPRVLALDSRAATHLAQAAADLDLISPVQARFSPATLPFKTESFDALVAVGLLAAPGPFQPARVLRPGGRFIALVRPEERDHWLAALAQAGYVHLYSERDGDECLVRGERPPAALRPADRMAALAGTAQQALTIIDPRTADLRSLGRHVHLLVAQTPNKPAWRLVPTDALEWHTPVFAAPDRAALAPAFTSLVKAVQFMQAAVLAGALPGINKVGKFSAEAARAWSFHLAVNLAFEVWRANLGTATLAWAPLDWRTAARGDE
jgi:hypothetical protein